MLPAQTKPKSLEWRLNSSFFFFSFYTRGGCVSCLRACLGVVEVQVLLYVHRNRRLIRDGSPEPPPRLSHSSWPLNASWALGWALSWALGCFHSLISSKLQALVYDILPSITAVFSYAIGSRQLSAKEQVFCWCSNSSKLVTNNSNHARRVIYSRQQSLHQHK